MNFSTRTIFQHVYQQVSYGSASLTPGAATTGTTVTATIACGNCQIGDFVDVSAPAAIGNLTMTGEVTAIGTVTVKFANATAGSLTAPSGIYRVVAYSLGADFLG